MNAQHPPGPYLIEGNTVYVLNDEGGNRFSAQVQRGCYHKQKISDEEAAAVVRLFAAAPNLLLEHDQTISDMRGLLAALEGEDIRTAKDIAASVANRCSDALAEAANKPR